MTPTLFAMRFGPVKELPKREPTVEELWDEFDRLQTLATAAWFKFREADERQRKERES